MTSDIQDADPTVWGHTYLGPEDPADLFHNVGVNAPDDGPWEGHASIDHFYYGMVGEAFALDGTRTRIPDVAQWAVEFPGGHDGAARIWRNRATISDIVARHGGRARVRVDITDDTLTVTEYDWRRWTDTAPAAP